MSFALESRRPGLEGHPELADGGQVLDDLVRAAQLGDAAARDHVIRCHWTFIQKVASRVTKRPVGTDDDLWSVALIAFNEAIDTYKQESRASFRTFANTVISRRLIDRFRRRARRREVPFSLLEVAGEQGDTYNPISLQEARRRHALAEDAADLRREVIAYREQLQDYGVELDALVSGSPSQQGARERAFRVADLLVQDPSCKRYFSEQKKLPLKELAAMPQAPVSRQTMERNRAYIVAVALLKLGEFPQILGFVED